MTFDSSNIFYVCVLIFLQDHYVRPKRTGTFRVCISLRSTHCGTSDHVRHPCLLSGADPGGARGPGPPLTTKNEAPAPKFYKIEAPEWQF